jgi:hypothetical protein
MFLSACSASGIHVPTVVAALAVAWRTARVWGPRLPADMAQRFLWPAGAQMFLV